MDEKASPPPGIATAMSVRELGGPAPATRVPEHKQGQEIAPGFLSILDPRPAMPQSESLASAIAAPDPDLGNGPSSSGRRTVLASWIASAANPLTARVAVNRIWQHHFGRGLAATTGDLGAQGERPTHPELLDYLAAEFVGPHAWSMKPLHRAMLTSATYRQSSSVANRDEAVAADPDNKLLWRMPLRRIEAEVVRDSVLAASGELSLAMAGPSALPELPRELSQRYGWSPSPRHRRPQPPQRVLVREAEHAASAVRRLQRAGHARSLLPPR